MTDFTSIAEYYVGKHVFITGGTGFIGKVLIEKLLRSCPGIAGVHCLVRPKRGKSIQERLEAMLTQPMFERLHNEQPDFTKKLKAISGDVVEPNLGISAEDREFLQKNVNIVFHSAATINFNEKMRLALELNLVGVQKMIALAKSMEKLEVFLHVSTAYANCDRLDIDEVVYPPPVKPEKILDMLSWASDDVLDTLTPYLIAEKPNTYTYTKQLAEALLVEEGAGLPLSILRPSIVTAAHSEPLMGWIDNYNGPSGLIVAHGKGLLRTFYADKMAKADFIPVDLVANAMIAISWSTAMAKSDVVIVYQATSGDLNPITWDLLERECVKMSGRVPMDDTIGSPIKIITYYRFLDLYRKWLRHWIPAYLMDFASILIGKQPRMISLYEKIHKGSEVLLFFTVRSWRWNNKSLLELNESMLPQDKEIFRIDPRTIHWTTYVENYYLGVKKYLMKEKMANVRKARSQQQRVRRIEYLVRLGLFLIALKLAAKSETLRNCWFRLVSLMIRLLQRSGVLAAMYRTGFMGN